jgi:hypothetical protein
MMVTHTLSVGEELSRSFEPCLNFHYRPSVDGMMSAVKSYSALSASWLSDYVVKIHQLHPGDTHGNW